MLKLSPNDFIQLLDSHSVSRVHFTLDPSAADKKWKASHGFLQPVADHFNNDRDFDGHEAAFIGVGERSGVLLSAVVHRSNRGPGAGGVRNWYYDNVEAFIREGLRLSKGMTMKNALAGLWWGGGKGVVARNSGKSLDNPMDENLRKLVYLDYGEFMTSLCGCYITAEDVGTTLKDMETIYSKTRFTTCIPAELGGSGIPAIPTALGVLVGLEAAFDFLSKKLKGSTIVVQGVGHVGSLLVKHLFDKGVRKIIASDVDPAGKADEIRSMFKDYDFELVVVGKDDFSILYREADACCPCAVGGILNQDTIPKIKTKIIVGAANNQLKDINNDDKLLKQNGIVYVPDFLVNRMGIVNCADEHLGTIKNDPKLEKHLGRSWSNSIYNLSMKILHQSQESDKTTHEIATEIAEERSLEINPLYGHRGLEIIQAITK